MLRRVIGFHQDEQRDWVAELDCLHSQHVRHQPPFRVRAWVMTEAGRTERVGSEMDCPLCDRAELPEGLSVIRTLGPFDQSTVPAALQRGRRTSAATWGLLRVLDGSITFMLETQPRIERSLRAGDLQPIPPEVRHSLRVDSAVRLVLQLLTRPES